MKLLQAINPVTWVNKAIDNRIKRYGKGVGTEMKYNPLLVSMERNANDKLMTRRLLENSVWYSGIEQDIKYFYTKEAPKFYRNGEASESLNYFWAKQNDSDFRMVHSGFPQLISEKMVDLIIGNGFNIKVEGENEETLQEELDNILEDNKSNMLMSKSIEMESWSGGTSWKLSFNPDVSDYPIIEAWQPEDYTNKVISGRVVEDIFYTYYEKDNIKYRLSEMYGVEKGVGAYIDYRLEQLQFDTRGQANVEAKWMDTSLSDLDETKDLKRLVFNGYFNRLSLYKPNKLPNSEFRYSILGESDYSGSYGAFDAVDEIISTWVQEFRDSKLNRYFPEEFMQQSNGVNKFPSTFKKNHIIYADSPSENSDKQKIMYEQGDLRTEKHVESYKIWVTQILNNAGLSPLTVGVTGLESIDASAESQQEREKVSIRTRNKKIELWKEFLEDILKTVLELRLMTKSITSINDQEFNVGSLPEFDIIASFEDYIIKSKRDRTNEVAEGYGIGWDTLTGVKYIHSDKTEREQLAISARIKIQNGDDSLTQAEASALEAENLITNEELQEDGVNILTVNENEVVTGIEESDIVAPNEEEI